MFYTLKIIVEKENTPTEYIHKSFMFKSSLDNYVIKYIRNLISYDNTSIKLKSGKLVVTTYNNTKINTRIYFENN